MVNARTGFTYVHAVHVTLFSSKNFICNAQNSMCMQYFFADELTTGAIPEMENTVLEGILETLLTSFYNRSF